MKVSLLTLMTVGGAVAAGRWPGPSRGAIPAHVTCPTSVVCDGPGESKCHWGWVTYGPDDIRTAYDGHGGDSMGTVYAGSVHGNWKSIVSFELVPAPRYGKAFSYRGAAQSAVSRLLRPSSLL